MNFKRDIGRGIKKAYVLKGLIFPEEVSVFLLLNSF